MKVRYNIEISDEARNMISREHNPRAKKRLASRQEVINLFDLFLKTLEDAATDGTEPPDVVTIITETRTSYQRGSDQVRDYLGLPRVVTGR